MARVAPRNTYGLVDRILDGKLASMLTDWRTQGYTIDAIVDRLRDEHQIDVGRETVRRWLTQDIA